MKREDDPQLWDLLGHSRVPEPSAFFARNVVRAVRNQPPPPIAFASWLRLRWLVPSFSAVAALIVTLLTLHQLHQHQRPSTSIIARATPASAMPQPTQVASANVPDTTLVADLEVLSGPDDDSDDTVSL